MTPEATSFFRPVTTAHHLDFFVCSHLGVSLKKWCHVLHPGGLSWKMLDLSMKVVENGGLTYVNW
jgi:hypothetical protein